MRDAVSPSPASEGLAGISPLADPQMETAVFDFYQLEVSLSEGRFRWSLWNGRRFEALRRWRVDGPQEGLRTLGRLLGGRPDGEHLVTDSSSVEIAVETIEVEHRVVRVVFRLARAPELGVFTFASSLPWFVDTAARLAEGDRAVLALSDVDDDERHSAVPVLTLSC